MVSKSGWYYFELEDIKNGCKSVDSIQVFENFEVPSILLDDEFYLACDEDFNQIEPSISSTQDVQIEWMFNEVLISTELNPILSEGGNYYLKVTNNQSNCFALDSTIVYPPNEIKSLITSEMNALCSGESTGSISITEIQGGTPDFKYFLNNSPKEDGEFINLSSGVFDIMLIDAKCTFDTTITLQDPGPIFSSNTLKEYTVKKGQSVQVKIQTNIDASDIVSVDWSPAIDCSDCLSYTFDHIEKEQLYSITITDVNGCEQSIEIRINIDDNFDIYLPNAINPNSIENNIFYPQSSLYNDMTVHEMSIYDRWGNLVFRKEHFPINDKQFGWDGTFKNSQVNSGVFVYVIRLQKEEKKYELVGDVTVIR